MDIFNLSIINKFSVLHFGIKILQEKVHLKINFGSKELWNNLNLESSELKDSADAEDNLQIDCQ